MRKYELEDFLYDFPNEDAAYEYVLAIKKPKVKVYKRKKGTGYSTATGEYYAPLQNTVFRGARLDLDKWFLAVFLMHYSGFWSVKEFKDRLKVNYITAFQILTKLRPHINRKITFINNLDQMILGDGNYKKGLRKA